jgi:hypothetical protein
MSIRLSRRRGIDRTGRVSAVPLEAVSVGGLFCFDTSIRTDRRMVVNFATRKERELDRAEGLVMSEQAEKFLAQWEFEHIADSDIVARADREDQARRLALRCREDAAKAGISSQDLEAAAEGNLIGNMLQALDAAEFRQMYRDQLADQED